MLRSYKSLIIILVIALAGYFIYQLKFSEKNAATVLKATDALIEFAHTDENEGEDLIIASDKKVYQGFSGTTIYFNIDPPVAVDEEVALQFYFTDPKAKVVQIYQRKDNAWWALEMKGGQVTDSKFSSSYKRRKELEGKIYAQSKASYHSSGETEFFMAEISYPPGSPGQFLIEAFGENGSYGLLDPWYDSGWDYRKKITINPQNVTAGLSNFPMLFSRVDLELRATTSSGYVASSTGGDILFTDENHAKIPHEIEYYASTTGELIAWVKVPFVSSTSTREIYIYYGNDTVPLANQQDVTNVWNSNYIGVWHLKDGTTLN
ncbi:MAG: DUF2341 domain-containing protein, partial [Patescibacteria group bacterium]